MIITKDSILRTIPQNLSEREIFILSSAIHSINVIDISYSRLKEQLDNDDEDLASELPMIDVWNIIDSSHRLRCLLEKIPGIKKRELWFQSAIRKLKETEELRNFIQHYNGEVDKLISQIQPLLGHLSWTCLIDNGSFKIGLIVPGTLRQFKNLKVGNPAGKTLRDRIDLIEYRIGTCAISISDLVYQMNDLVAGLENHIQSKNNCVLPHLPQV